MFYIEPCLTEAKVPATPPAPQLESPGSADQAGGLAPPPEPSMNGEGGEEGEAVPAEPEKPEEPQTATKKWMDFEEFCRCFKYGTNCGWSDFGNAFWYREILEPLLIV